MLFGIFKNKEIDAFARNAVDRFAKRCPATLQDEASARGDQSRTAAIRTLHSDVLELRRRMPLGVYRKAYMANSLKWELKERGFRKEFVNSVVYDLLFALAGSQKQEG